MTSIGGRIPVNSGLDVLSSTQVKIQPTQKPSSQIDVLLQQFIADPVGSINLSSVKRVRTAANAGELLPYVRKMSTTTLKSLCQNILRSPGLPESSKSAVVGDLVKDMRVADVPILDVTLQDDPAVQSLFRKGVMAKCSTPHKLALMQCLGKDGNSAEVNLLLGSKKISVGGAWLKPTDVLNHLGRAPTPDAVAQTV
ncbi:MAG: hypothetical protein ACK5A0_12115 [Polaromonas sp.]|jgi:hypothetical protein